MGRESLRDRDGAGFGGRRVLSEACPSVLGELTHHSMGGNAIGGEFLLRADGQGPRRRRRGEGSATRTPARGGGPEEGGTWLAAGRGPAAGAKAQAGVAVLMLYDPLGA